MSLVRSVSILALVLTACGSSSEPANAPAPSGAGSAAAPAKSCTEMACSDRFTVKLRQKPHDPKDWVAELEIDGKKLTCAFAWEASKAATCSPGLTMQLHEPPIEDGVTATVQYAGAPASVGFTLLHHGKPVEEKRTFTPEYTKIEPNGPGCPPTCREGSGRFLLK